MKEVKNIINIEIPLKWDAFFNQSRIFLDSRVNDMVKDKTLRSECSSTIHNANHASLTDYNILSNASNKTYAQTSLCSIKARK